MIRFVGWFLLLLLITGNGIRAQDGETASYRVTYIQYGEAYGDGQIWTMNPDGSDQQVLSDLTSVLPVIASDGEHIAFMSNENGEYAERLWDLSVLDVSSGETQTLVSQAKVTHVTWSPDGERLLFFTFTYDGLYRAIGDLLVVNADGANPLLLASDHQLYAAPVWSPDSRTILFDSHDDDIETLFVVNADGTNLRALHTDIPCFICAAPNWTQDGRYIVYLDYPDVYRMDASCIDQPETCDDATVQITDFSADYNAIDVYHARYGTPIYSIASDSSFLIYTFGYRHDGGGIDIARMSFDAAGWANRQMLYHGDYYLYGALLSPDDNLIFFNDGDTIYRMNADGSDLRPLLQGNLYGFIHITG